MNKLYIPPLAICAVGLLVHQGRLDEIGKAYEARTNENAETANAIGSTAKASQQKLVDSGRALERFKAGCIGVVETETMHPVRMATNQSVTVARGVPMTFDDGEIVCNELGDAASLKDGKPTDITRIAPEHEDEFLPFKNQLIRERTQ